jgi:AcrR family transcriptional regulator
MVRWEPNARERLAQAALELYLERGYEQTTVAEIAARAGLTERTFFRHFADKREVLFAGSGELERLLTEKVAEARAELSPLDAVAAGLQALVPLFELRGDYPRQRSQVVAANADLQERELIKMAKLAVATAGALRRRGVKEPVASLTAEAGIAVFRVSFARWVDPSNKRKLSTLIRDSMKALKAVTAAG